MTTTRLPSALILSVLLASVLSLTPTLAHAGNGAHPRTPVDWSGAPCMTIIDRSLLGMGAVHPLTYAIPYEDIELTPDEVTDSRTHQFFAYCRDRHLEDILPGWVTEADVQAAVDKNLGMLDSVDLELDVLENAPDWASCWSRITEDVDRRPITFAAAAEPVPWDTSMLAAGTYVVDGYTYEPWYNLWSPHPGVFKIVDDLDPAASPPAAALTFFEQTVNWGDEASITGCVDAMDGATMTLSWSNGNINGEPNWLAFAEDMPAPTGSFELGFVPPIEAASNSVMIKLDIVDPLDREWTAYSRAYIAVVEDVGDEGCDSGGFVSNPCDTDTSGDDLDTSTGTGTSTSAGGGSESGPPLTDGGTETGCSCSSTSPTRGMWMMFAMAGLLLFGRSRRR
jgi:MYXO-CTERM domain-containing protein